MTTADEQYLDAPVEDPPSVRQDDNEAYLDEPEETPGIIRRGMNFMDRLAANPEQRIQAVQAGPDVFTDPTLANQPGVGLSGLKEQAIGVGETGLTLGTGMLAWPLGKMVGLGMMAEGATREEIDAREMEIGEAMTYQPTSEPGKKYSEAVGKGFEYLLWPAAQADALVSRNGYKRLGWLTGLAGELLTFKGLHVGAKKIKTKLKPSKLSEADITKLKDKGVSAEEIEVVRDLVDNKGEVVRDLFKERFGLEDPTAPPAPPRSGARRAMDIHLGKDQIRRPVPAPGSAAARTPAQKAFDVAAGRQQIRKPVPLGPNPIKRSGAEMAMQPKLKESGKQKGELPETKVDVWWDPEQYKGKTTDGNDLVNSIPDGTPYEKALALRAKSQENQAFVEDFLQEVDADLGTKSGWSYKKIDTILEKAKRPAILEEKPYHGVEHIRDAFRFKVVANTFEDFKLVMDKLIAKGVKIEKLDMAKQFHPKEWGWRFGGADIRMPNGQIIEMYSPLREMEVAKKRMGHDIFDKWRDKSKDEIAADPVQLRLHYGEMATSRRFYDQAFQTGLRRLGLDSAAAEALWNQLEASLPSTASYRSRMVAGAGIPLRQTPPSKTIHIAPSLDPTQTVSPSLSLETIKGGKDLSTTKSGKDLSAIVSPPFDQKVTPPTPPVNPPGEKILSTKTLPEPPAPIADIKTNPGNPGALYIGNKRYPVTYELAEARDLITSHRHDTFAPDPRYPERTQERLYDTDKAEQLKVIKHAQKIKPRLVLTDNPDAVNGPPIITPDGIVRGGNSRAMSIRRAYELGKPGDKYKRALKDHYVKKYGIDPAAVDQFKEPVLVRKFKFDTSDPQATHRLVSELNVSPTAAKSEAATMVSRGANVGLQTLESLGDILSESGNTLREHLAKKDGIRILDLLIKDKVIPASERPRYVNDRLGVLNGQGKLTVEGTVLGSIITDPSLLDVNPAMLKKISGSLTPLARLKARQGEAWDLTPHLEPALELAHNAKAAETTPSRYVNQSALPGFEADIPTYSRVSIVLAEHLFDRDMSMTKLRGKFNEFAGRSMIDAKDQGSLFAGEEFGRPDPVKAFKEIFEDGLKSEIREEQLSLFGDQEKYRDPFLKPKDRQQSLFGEAEPVRAPKADRQVPEKTAPPPLKGQMGLFDKAEIGDYSLKHEGWKDIPDTTGSRGKPPASKLHGDVLTAGEIREPTQIALPFEEVKFTSVPDKRVGAVKTDSVQAPSKVRNAGEAAAVVEHLPNQAQERLYTITVDKAGKILEIHHAFTGSNSKSTVSQVELAGRILRNPDAAKTYVIHNHPGGKATPSGADIGAYSFLAHTLNLKGVTTEGIVVARGFKYRNLDPLVHGENYLMDLNLTDKPIPLVNRPGEQPVVSRIFKEPATGPRITPENLTDVIQTEFQGREGFVLLDGGNNAVGFEPWKPGSKTRDVAAGLISKVESSGARSAIFNSHDFLTPERTRFLKDLSEATTGDVTWLDVVEHGQSRMLNHEALPYAKIPVGGPTVAGGIQALRSMNTATELYGGVPVHKFTGHKLYEKYIGAPLWDKHITGSIPNALQRIPIIGRAVSGARRFFDPDYRGNLPRTKDYIALTDDARRGRQIGADYAIDLGNRLAAVPESSQLKIGQAITGKDVKLNPIETKLASEANWAMLELGKKATTLGLVSEEVFFKNAGRYMPRLYTTKEFNSHLSKWGLARPERIDMARFKARKDIPKEIRREMGEILTPAYPVAKGIVQLTHSIETGEWFRHISRNKEWSAGGPVNAQVKADVRARAKELKAREPSALLEEVLNEVGQEFPDLNIFTRKTKKGGQWFTETVIEKAQEIPAGWEKLPDTPALGDLRGSYVHPEIARDVNWTLKTPTAAAKLNQKWLTRWKSGKVLWSWKTHVRNNLSNGILSHLGGLPLYEQPTYLARAAREISKKGKYYRLAQKEGLYSTTFVNSELRGLFDQVEARLNGVKAGSLESTMDGIGVGATMLRSANRKLGDMYQWEESWHKTAKVIHNMEKRGMTAREAVADANKWLFDYGKVSKSLGSFRQSLFGAPFATFTAKAIPRVMEAMVKTPHRFILPGALIWGLEEAARARFGDTKDQAAAKAEARPDWMQGNFLGIPNFARVPFADSQGREQWLNMSYILPWGDIAESGGAFGIPGGLMPGSHPLTKEIIQQASNYDWFWKEPIVGSEEVAGKSPLGKLATGGKERLAHGLQTFAPTVAMDASKLATGALDLPDYRGRDRGIGPVLFDILGGLKAYPVNYIEEMARQIDNIHPSKSPDARKILAKMKTVKLKRKAMKDKGRSTEIYDKQFEGFMRQLMGLTEEARGKAEIFKRLRK